MGTFLAGCATVTPTVPPPVQPTAAATLDLLPTVNQARTQAVETAMFNLTQNAPTATPVQPTETVLAATATFLPAISTQVVQTTLANLTQIALTSAPTKPTATPIPPMASPTLAAPRFTLVPSLSPTPVAYSCYLLDASPKPSDKITVGASFEGKWTVANTGTAGWPRTMTDIRYISGEKFQTKGDVVDLGVDVARGGAYNITIAMKAPKYAGIYFATWAIKYGDLKVCSLNLKVTVIK